MICKSLIARDLQKNNFQSRKSLVTNNLKYGKENRY